MIDSLAYSLDFGVGSRLLLHWFFRRPVFRDNQVVHDIANAFRALGNVLGQLALLRAGDVTGKDDGTILCNAYFWQWKTYLTEWDPAVDW